MAALRAGLAGVIAAVGLGSCDATAEAVRGAPSGRETFLRYCAHCHGTEGDGQGPAARLYSPPPANLRASRQTDAYKAAIIRQGGASLGRSPYMPPWEKEIGEAGIRELVAYLRELAGPLKASP